MRDNDYRKIEYYLYNYENPELLMKEAREKYIYRMNASTSSWLRSIHSDGNTMEEQVIKMIENNEIENIKKWQALIKKVLVFFSKRYPKYYDFLVLRYFDKHTLKEIRSILNLSAIEQKVIRIGLIRFIYKNAIKENLISRRC